MWRFEAVKDNGFSGCSKLMSLCLFPEHNDVLIYGALQTLFGEPAYITENFEDVYSYSLVAKNEEGKEICFEVYQGSSGCAVGGSSMSELLASCVEELKRLLTETTPKDYVYEGNYMDAGMKIRCGIQNGQPFFEEEMM